MVSANRAESVTADIVRDGVMAIDSSASCGYHLFRDASEAGRQFGI